MSRYEEAKKMYAAFGADAERALEKVGKYPFPCIAGRGTT